MHIDKSNKYILYWNWNETLAHNIPYRNSADTTTATNNRNRTLIDKAETATFYQSKFALVTMKYWNEKIFFCELFAYGYLGTILFPFFFCYFILCTSRTMRLFLSLATAILQLLKNNARAHRGIFVQTVKVISNQDKC